MVVNKQTTNTILVSVFILFSLTLHPSIIAELLISFFHLPNRLYRLLTALTVYFIAISLFTKLYTTRKKILYLYLATILYLVLLEVFLYSGTANSTIGQINRLILGCCYLVILKSKKVDIRLFNKIFINFSFIICVYSLLSHFNIIPELIKSSYFYRNQGLFSEPARFAQFLQFPMFFSIIRFYKKKTFTNLLIAIVIVTSFITTFSVANFFGLLLSLIIFYIIVYTRKKYYYKKRIPFARYFVSALMALIFLFITIKFYNISNSLDYNEKLIGKNISYVIRNIRIERFQISASALDHSFYGNRKLGLVWVANPGAIGIHIIQGGYILVFFVLAYTFIFFKHLFKHLPYSPNPILYMSLIAFFIAFNWYGDYTEVYYLFLIALSLRFIDEEKINKKSIVL